MHQKSLFFYIFEKTESEETKITVCKDASHEGLQSTTNEYGRGRGQSLGVGQAMTKESLCVRMRACVCVFLQNLAMLTLDFCRRLS